jgi:hypothetical protein
MRSFLKQPGASAQLLALKLILVMDNPHLPRIFILGKLMNLSEGVYMMIQ